MSLVTVVTQKKIARPLAQVRGQFGDLHHHVAHNVHPEIVLEILGSNEGGCDYYQTQTTFGQRRRNKVQLSRCPDGSVRVRYLEGPDAGVESLSSFEPIGDAETLVTQRNTVPLKGLLTVLGWLVKREVRKQSSLALEQDRVDLETRGYPAA